MPELGVGLRPRLKSVWIQGQSHSEVKFRGQSGDSVKISHLLNIHWASPWLTPEECSDVPDSIPCLPGTQSQMGKTVKKSSDSGVINYHCTLCYGRERGIVQLLWPWSKWPHNFVASDNHLLCSQTLWAGNWKGLVGMASLCSALFGVHLGRSQGWEWLYGWGLDSADGSSVTRLALGPWPLAKAPACGLATWLGFLLEWRLASRCLDFFHEPLSYRK